MGKCWIYHPEHDPKIVDSDDSEGWYGRGWFDSPAKFIKTTDFGVEPGDELAVQGLGAAIDGVKDAANGALNVGKMQLDEIAVYAHKHLDAVPPDGGVRIQRRWLKEQISQ